MLKQKSPYTEKQEREFLAWIRTQPSCLTGETRNIVAAHVRRVSEGAGIGIKPRLFAVPLTREQHDYQHHHGELACLLNYKDIVFMYPYEFNPLQQAKEQFEIMALSYREKFLSLNEF